MISGLKVLIMFGIYIRYQLLCDPRRNQL